MRKRALRKDFFMEIKRSMNRFLSIFLIVALGVAFYSGIQSSAPDMEATGDLYFDRQLLMDLKVVSTLGLTEEDELALSALEGIETAEGAYMTDVLCGEADNQKAIRVESITENFQKLQPEEGRLPLSPGECFLDASAAAAMGIKVGDIILVQEDEDDPVLRRESFTVAGIGGSPAYISFGRGNTTLGSGEVSGFCYVLPEDFDMEVYAQVFLSVKGAGERTAFTEEYRELIDNVKREVSDIQELRCQARYNEIKGEADGKLADARKELEDGRKEAEEKLADAEKEIEDGEQKLAEGKEELSQGKKDLEEAKKKLSDGQAELEEKEKEWADGQAELAQKKQELSDGRAELDQKELELKGAKSELESGFAELTKGKETLSASESQYQAESEKIAAGESSFNGAKQEYESGLAQYEAGMDQINKAYAQLDKEEKALEQAAELSEEGKAAYEEGYPRIVEARVKLNNQESELTVVKSQLDDAKQELDAQEALLLDGKSQLESAQAELDGARSEIAANEARLNSAQAELNEGEAQLESARAELDAGEQQLLDAEQELEDGKKQLDDARTELSDGKKDISDAEKKIADAGADIEENEKKLSDGRRDYEDAKREAEESIRDGEKKISDAEGELSELDFPEWTISDRDDLPDYTGYGENADRMRSLGEVFPVLFFLVAALISLTTMTRMVEEERTQIGTMKALGYGKLSIAGKYIGYAFLATVGGSILGVLAGEKILPFVIIYAYGIMYQHMDVMVLEYQMDHALVASAVALLCTMAGTISACYRELAAAPAVLMRPPAPKEGKRVLLERLTFIWKHLSFSWKSTVRNLFRYKKRLFMTILGIGGCMALILVGFGLRDSIMDVAVIQYQELQLYDGMIVLDENAGADQERELKADLTSRTNVADYMDIYMKKISMRGEKGQCDVFLVIPESLDGFQRFYRTRDRVTGEEFSLGDDGVILAEKTARMMGVKAGDTVSIQQDGGNMSVTVSAVCENYMQNFAYISPGLYEKASGELPKYNNIIFCGTEKNEEAIERTGQEILKNEAALSITYTGNIKERLDEMLGSLDIVIVVLIISAGMLAFVVLYNLNNISINERKRELATLKVLGFFDLEVSAYVFRENVLLTLLGAALGAVLGTFLHEFVITTVEIESYMFGRTVKPLSYLISIAITCGFSLFVNMMMHRKLKKIDMVESLKSVE